MSDGIAQRLPSTIEAIGIAKTSVSVVAAIDSRLMALFGQGRSAATCKAVVVLLGFFYSQLVCS